VYAAFSTELWRALVAVSGGRLDVAREATAESFARLVEHASEVRDPRAWLYRTGYRLVVDELRKEARSATLMPQQSADVEAGLSAELVDALRRLPPAQRLAVFLTYQAGLSPRGVAEVTGVPVATVRVRLHRARRALRSALEPAEGEVSARA
jgi:RNA polymerase sigma factor (sigma-70 family)